MTDWERLLSLLMGIQWNGGDEKCPFCGVQKNHDDELHHPDCNIASSIYFLESMVDEAKARPELLEALAAREKRIAELNVQMSRYLEPGSVIDHEHAITKVLVLFDSSEAVAETRQAQRAIALAGGTSTEPRPDLLKALIDMVINHADSPGMMPKSRLVGDVRVMTKTTGMQEATDKAIAAIEFKQGKPFWNDWKKA